MEATLLHIYRLYLGDRCHVRRRIPACETAVGLEGHMCAPVSLSVAFTTVLDSIIELKLYLLSHIVSWQQLVLQSRSCTEPTLRPRRFIGTRCFQSAALDCREYL